MYGIIKTMVATCSKCGTCIEASKADLDDVHQVLEVAPTRADAPNANICRAALKAKHGPKRAKQLIDMLLKDKVIPATKAYPRRHVLLLDQKPLRPKKHISQEELTQQTS